MPGFKVEPCLQLKHPGEVIVSGAVLCVPVPESLELPATTQRSDVCPNFCSRICPVGLAIRIAHQDKCFSVCHKRYGTVSVKVSNGNQVRMRGPGLGVFVQFEDFSAD